MEKEQNSVKRFIRHKVLPITTLITRAMILLKYPLALCGTISLGLFTPYILAMLGMIIVSSIIKSLT